MVMLSAEKWGQKGETGDFFYKYWRVGGSGPWIQDKINK
jgi:hypothetical protein